MLVIRGKKVTPSFFKQLVLTDEKQGEIYISKLTCDNKKEIFDYSYIMCRIDLKKIPKGFYKIALLVYGIENYRNKNFPSILVLEDEKKEEKLKLIDAFSNITEYYSDQEINLKFSKNIDRPNLIKNIFISNNRNQHFSIQLSCNYGPDHTVSKCNGDFSKVRGGMYLIERVQFSDNDAHPSRNITIKINEQPMYELKLLSLTRVAFQGNTTLYLTFNGDVILNAFTGFYLFNLSSLFEASHRKIYKYNKSTIVVDINFKNVPEGTYNIGLFYRGYDWRYHDKYITVIKNITVEKSRYPEYDRNSKNIFKVGQSKQRANLGK